MNEQKLTTTQVKAMAIKRQSFPVTGGIVTAGVECVKNYSRAIITGLVFGGGLLVLVALLSM